MKIPEGVQADSPFVQILDPATGTATFLVEVIAVIHRTLTAKWTAQRLTEQQQQAAWNAYVPKHLLPRLHGYELMMTPYAIAHMKIGLKLYECLRIPSGLWDSAEADPRISDWGSGESRSHPRPENRHLYRTGRGSCLGKFQYSNRSRGDSRDQLSLLYCKVIQRADGYGYAQLGTSEKAAELRSARSTSPA